MAAWASSVLDSFGVSLLRLESEACSATSTPVQNAKPQKQEQTAE